MFQENKINSPNYQIPSFEAIQKRKLFYTSAKFTDETVFEWYKRVENAGNQCEFNHLHDFLILDKFVTGLNDGILKRLSEKIVLSLDEIFAIASPETQESSLSVVETQVQNEDLSTINSNILLKNEIHSDHSSSDEFVAVYKDENYTEEDSNETFKNEENFEGKLSSPASMSNSATICDKRELEVSLEESTSLAQEERQHVCSICNKRYKLKSYLHLHQRIHTGKNLHSCKYCGKVFPRRTKMTAHLISHLHDGKKFECYICLQQFQRLANVKAHFTTRHTLDDAETFQCRYCAKTYLNSKTYRAHLKFHTGEKELISCSLCDKQFEERKHYYNHMVTHTKNKLYTCETCGKSYVHSKQLYIHFRTHTGEKPYTCKVCQKKFASSQVYKVHQRIHSGEKPFKCKLCDKSFVQLANMKKHQRTHNNEKDIGCSMCDRKFATNYHLRLHMSVHTGAKPYKCHMCDKAYTQPGTLAIHKSKVHP